MDEKELFQAYKDATLKYLKEAGISHDSVMKMLLAMHLVSTEFLNAVYEQMVEKSVKKT
jgi:hypothetical protein